MDPPGFFLLRGPICWRTFAAGGPELNLSQHLHENHIGCVFAPSSNADLCSCGRRAFSVHTFFFFFCADLEKNHWSLAWILHRFSTGLYWGTESSSGSNCAHHHIQEDKTSRLICQTRCKPAEARWRLGVKAEVRGAAQRNAPRSACVIINGCQRLFSGRTCWQTALQKHRDCVNASLGWMRELRVLAKRLWQMIQVTKPGQSPSSAAIWGIPGHL